MILSIPTEGLLALAFVLLVVLAGAATPWLRRPPRPSPEAGRAGERRVQAVVGRSGLPAMHDVYLRTDSGATQIDHIVRAGRTIFILETKHFGGTCYGRAYERTWTHVNRGAKRRFYNPLLQNDGHVAAVRRAVGWGCRLRPYVVFSGSAAFPSGMPEGVLGLGELDDLLSRASRSRLPSLLGVLGWRKLERRAETAETAGNAHRRSLARAGAR